MEAAIPCSDTTDTRGFDLSPEARAQADLKFTYVVTCQIYGRQREQQKPEASDIALLMQRWVAWYFCLTESPTWKKSDCLTNPRIIFVVYNVLYSEIFLNRNEALRIAYIDDIESLKDGKVHKEFYSKLVKADINGKDKVLFLSFNLSILHG